MGVRMIAENIYGIVMALLRLFAPRDPLTKLVPDQISLLFRRRFTWRGIFEATVP